MSLKTTRRSLFGWVAGLLVAPLSLPADEKWKWTVSRSPWIKIRPEDTATYAITMMEEAGSSFGESFRMSKGMASCKDILGRDGT